MEKIISMFFIAAISLSYGHSSLADLERQKGTGYCGDGIINGNEDCDGGAVKIRRCQELNGGEGEIKCRPNCVYDISDCDGARSARIINELFNDRTEICKTQCNPNGCDGGCAPVGDVGSTRTSCLYKCSDTCTSKCGNLLESRMEYSLISCECDVDTYGNPQCLCGLDESKTAITFSPTIGEQISRM